MEAGLPLEDTLSSEDKYYEFTRLANVDLVIMPYYGTGFSSSAFLIINRFNYAATVSLQFYSPRENIFIHRADAVATERYSIGFGSLAILGASLVDMLVQASGEITKIGSIIGGILTVFDLFKTLQPAERRYAAAFDVAVADALSPFVAARGGNVRVESGPGRSPDATSLMPSDSTGVSLRIDRLRTGYTVEIDGQPYPIADGWLSAVLPAGEHEVVVRDQRNKAYRAVLQLTGPTEINWMTQQAKMRTNARDALFVPYE